MTAPSSGDPKHSARSFTRIPTVMMAQEILDSHFHRASKITISNPDAFNRMKATETSRIRSVQNGIASTLKRYVAKFPSFDQLPPFYRELGDLLLDMDKTRKALGSLDWAANRVMEIGDECASEIKRAPFAEVVLKAKSQAYGRISSIMNQIDPHLKHLNEARNELKRMPFIDAETPTIVVAGYPNVGKSSLVRKVSTGTPEVANYPFTTKGIVLGHFDHEFVRHQIVDTPGLLDRALEDRNAIERQAIMALRHLADVIVFLVDPSEHCGYTLEAQLKLLEETRKLFPETPVVVAESKSDLLDDKRDRVGEVAFSNETGAGIGDVMALALARIQR